MKFLGVLAVLLGATNAFAQGLPLPPIGPRRPPLPAPPPNQPNQPPRMDINWEGTLDLALQKAQAEGRAIVYMAIKDEQDRFLPAFRVEKVRALGEQSFAFVAEPLDSANRTQQDLKIKVAPTWVAMDKFGNILTQTSARLDAVQTYDWLNAVLAQAKSAADEVESRSAQAHQMLKKNQSSGIRKLIDFLNWARSKKGYPQIAEAQKTLQSLADECFVRARLQLEAPDTEKDGLATLKFVQDSFKGSAPAIQADLVLAEHLRRKGDVPGAWSKLDRVAADPKVPPAERDRARAAQTAILSEGLARLRSLLKAAGEGDWEAAQEALRQLKVQHAVTEVARHVDEVLKDLEEK